MSISKEDMTKLRTLYLSKTGAYSSDEDILEWASKSTQAQVGGSHYQDMPIQPWEYFVANSIYEEIKGACKQNILKYMRDKHDQLEDLKKARWYLNEWIAALEKLNA